MGTHFQQFDRLVRYMDEYARDHQEEVVIQAGYSRYEPKFAQWFRFVGTDQEMERLYQQADVIVAHGGAGTAIEALHRKKPLVILPRRAEQDEHVDDQQLELSKALSAAGLAIVVDNEIELAKAIDQARGLHPSSSGDRARLVDYIRTRVSSHASVRP